MKASFPHYLVEGQVCAGALGSDETLRALLALLAPFVLCTILLARCPLLDNVNDPGQYLQARQRIPFNSH